MKAASKPSILCVILVFGLFTSAIQVSAWSNGGYSDDSSNPDYGTHDWMAEHALDWLPANEKEYITTNLVVYLYGTELPDNPNPEDGIGDTTKHHIYFTSDEILVDDSAAIRAQEEYDQALSYLNANNLTMAAKMVGIMSHYIADMAVFGHVMGSTTDWGDELHHTDYENYVNERTNNYIDDFNSYLSFDGSLDNVSAYNAALIIAYDTTFDIDGDLTCVWMDNNYNWSDTTFTDRCGESLNLAVNYLTDVLHTLYVGTEQNILPIHVVINEVELNPTGNDNYLSVEEWVELYNPTSNDMDISNWKISTTHGIAVTITIPQGTTIPANGYYVYGRGSQWLDNDDESVVLQDSLGTEVDRTPIMSDDYNEDRSWQRYPNGQDSWRFQSSTKGLSNGGEAPGDDVPPTLTEVIIDPSSGPLGTIFTINAYVSDPSGVDSVVAHIQTPDEKDIATVTLTDPEDDGTYTGVWDSTVGSSGTYWVDVVARDILGNSGETENVASFTVVEEEEEAPEASFTYSPTMNLSIMVTISFEDMSTDLDGTIVSWLWNFGDNITSNNQNPTHKYGDKGTYIVKLTVTDNDTLTDTETQEINILNLAPTAEFTYSPEAPMAGQYVNFTDNSEDPEEKTLLHSWDFDDSSTSTERNPSHKYEEPGVYTVKLTVTDDEGAKDTHSITITITKLSSVITCLISSSEITEGDSIIVSGAISPQLSDETVTLTYKKPDGSTLDRTVVTGSDGSYTDSFAPDADGMWSVTASWSGDSTHYGASSSTKSFTVKKKACIIATATYGSELSPEVQFLREFRDSVVVKTFAGKNFMNAFNVWYYSFSPNVASAIAANDALRGLVKVTLYPLIGILHLTATTYHLFSFNPELGVVASGLSKDNDRTIIEPTEANEAKVIKYKKNSYVQQKQEDGSIVLVPVQKQVVFELTEKEGKLRTMRMNVAVRNFIDEYEVAGIYGLFATGERLTLEKMR